MNNTKVYTAPELREAILKIISFQGNRQTAIHIEDMLRQAAAMQERCEAEIAKLPYPPNADDVYMFKRLNYILRGDARKEEK